MPIDFTTPLGRIVQGDPFEGYTTDRQGKPLTTKTGPRAGQPRTAYVLAIAFPKVYWPGHPQQGQPNAEFAALYQQVMGEARVAFPNLFDAQGNCTHPRFTVKYMDGDGVDNNGTQNATKTGFAGHHIFRFSSDYPPQCVTEAGKPLTNKGDVKTGDWVRIVGSAKSNQPSDVPGLYMNLQGVIKVANGEEIRTGPNIAAMAAAAGAVGAGALPPGASLLPVAAALPGGAPGLPAVAGALPAALPAVAGGLPAVPGMLPAVAGPAPLPAAGLPAVAGAPALPAALPAVATPALPATLPPVLVLSPAVAGAGHTLESLRAAGHTDDQLIANGWATKQAPPPNPGFVAGAGLPPGPAVVAAPVRVPVLTLSPALVSAGHTLESLRGAGNTDAMILANGWGTMV